MRAAAMVLLVVLASGVPSAMSGWSGKGGYEPDTARDVADHWMWSDPDVSTTENRVYFNGFEGHSFNSLNPNVGAARSAVSGEAYQFYAMLGVWKDCNKDGYVGFGEQGLFEYRAELLLATPSNPCPVQATPRPFIPKDWFPSHNDGQWVREFLQIGWSFAWPGIGGTNDINPYNVNDNGSRVWVDYGYPEDPQAPPKCQVSPAPSGSFHQTGGIVTWADCSTRYRATDSFDIVAASAGLQAYSFADHPRDAQNSSSPLNQRVPWGSASDAPIVNVWDCSQPQVLQLWDVPEPQVFGNTNTDNFTNVSAPRVPPSVDPRGSGAGTVASLVAGFGQCRPGPATFLGLNSTRYGNAPYILEGDVVQRSLKAAPTEILHPYEITRPAAPYALLLGPATPPGPGDTGPYGGPIDPRYWGAADLGLGLATFNDLWMAPTEHQNEGPLVDASTLSIMPVQKVSYYAYVSPSAIAKYGLSLPNRALTGSYLAEACNGQTAPRNGWDCDGSHWYVSPSGADVQLRSRYLGRDQSITNQSIECARAFATNAGDYTNPTTNANSRACVSVAVYPGSPYNLRDLDCYDQSARGLREEGLSWAIFTGGACDVAP